ncbi:MAG TPA: FecR domain-containing protein [Bacteroidales bacterium]|nr:FecR domain-containing protein [Bacteroidales bacterium]
MKTRNGYSEHEWEQIASFLANETNDKTEPISRFLEEEGQLILNYWTNMETRRREEKVDIDKAWNVLYRRLEEDKLLTGLNMKRYRINTLIRVAAAAAILIGFVLTGRYIANNSLLSSKLSVVASVDEKNRVIDLRDGSKVYLNRESELKYPVKFSTRNRKVTLKGEAYFEISPDSDRPFIIDAEKASVEVLGTSFNVITSNENHDVEVFVSTGKVLLTSSDGLQQVTLEPGFIGTVNNENAEKSVNDDPNYLAWNTEILIFEGNTLTQVFSDLKKVYNLSVEVRSDDILDLRLTTTFNKNTPDTIILVICTAFNLKYEKVGDTYYLER